ncbi:MAG: YraN family protein [Paracoccaceae bacterium]
MNADPDTQARSDRGRLSYEAGQSAEDAIGRVYAAKGATLEKQRWRGSAGEIDLIFRLGDQVLFVEVKQAKTCAAAFTRVSPKQQARLFAAAEEYIGTLPSGLLTEIRFDVAAVDAKGMFEILENAFA